VQFPHRFHTELEGGCFACHSFAPSNAAGADARVAVLATTNFQAADCTNCHGGHDNVGGGACQQCHPFEQGTRDVYWLAAKLGADPRPDRPALADRTRPWPERNAFSHLSPGHADVKCADCHSAASLDVDNLGAMVAPDESLQLCRDCHLEKQFHWR